MYPKLVYSVPVTVVTVGNAAFPTVTTVTGTEYTNLGYNAHFSFDFEKLGSFPPLAHTLPGTVYAKF